MQFMKVVKLWPSFIKVTSGDFKRQQLVNETRLPVHLPPPFGANSLLRLHSCDTASSGHPFIKVVSLLRTFLRGGTRRCKWSIIAGRVIVAVPGIVAVFMHLQQDELWQPRQRDILQTDCHMMNYYVAWAYLLALRVGCDIYTKRLWPDKETD